MRGTRWYEHPHPQILSSTSGWSCNYFSCIKMKRFTVTVFKTIKQREQSLKITFHHRRFWNILRQGKFPRTFTGRLQGGGVSSLDADKPEPNMSSARVKARVALLPPAEVEHIFLPAMLTIAAVAFSAMLGSEDFTTNLLLCFMGLARASPSTDF
jgi:hypothetical protein